MKKSKHIVGGASIAVLLAAGIVGKQPVFHLLFADSGVHATVCDIFRKCKQHDGPFKR